MNSTTKFPAEFQALLEKHYTPCFETAKLMKELNAEFLDWQKRSKEVLIEVFPLQIVDMSPLNMGATVRTELSGGLTHVEIEDGDMRIEFSTDRRHHELEVLSREFKQICDKYYKLESFLYKKSRDAGDKIFKFIEGTSKWKSL